MNGISQRFANEQPLDGKEGFTCMEEPGRSFAAESLPGNFTRTASLAVTVSTKEPSGLLRVASVACLLLTVLSSMPDPFPRPRLLVQPSHTSKQQSLRSSDWMESILLLLTLLSLESCFLTVCKLNARQVAGMYVCALNSQPVGSRRRQRPCG